MDPALFDRLLHEEESSTLDFKKEQYRFIKASEADKSELLKDILGFANAWRRADAYILIGVEEVRGGRSNVCGVTEHLDDHSLQQFVNNLTNRPIRFHYEAFQFEGKQVGVLYIEQQPRPFYLKRDFGKLRKGDVYVRRGSSTDPTKPASPDEIAQMGVSVDSSARQAELTVEFGEVDGDQSFGAQVSWTAEFCQMPPREDIPDLGERRRQDSFFKVDLAALNLDPRNRPNRTYYRDLAEYELVMRLFRPVRLVVSNVGQVLAIDVRVELIVPSNAGVVIIYSRDVPRVPKKRKSMYDIADLPMVRPALRHAGYVEIDENDDRFKVEIDCGDLQPGRKVRSDTFHIGIGKTGVVPFAGQVLAGNLPEPHDFTLTIGADVSEREMTVDELLSLPEPHPRRRQREGAD